MREAAFIKQNMPRWKEYEKLLQQQQKLDPDKKAEIFIQLTDDLSFSRTQYPQSESTRYLNTLASKIHLVIYKNKSEDRSRFITFWTRELPDLLHGMYRYIFYAFLIFAISIFIGIISVKSDNTFARLILGDAYVNMTLENIRSGNPLGVYASEDQLNMFFGITFNNIRVSFYVFAAGLILSVGTGWLLFYNGIMVGTFFTFLAQNNQLENALGIVMLHGTIELTSIVIAGAAGLRMGHSILFPKTYSRTESFKKGAKDGLKVVMALIPFFIIAGFIESFVTRYSTMTWVMKALIIGLSVALIVFYFFIYPHKFRKTHGTFSENRTP
ncbi:MAG TPA: stage II sporulation protein M [Cyclobacteriaceae bacterium]|nr:stage II sporulation protein M [Cyclobacteriaceae bacterium]